MRVFFLNTKLHFFIFSILVFSFLGACQKYQVTASDAIDVPQRNHYPMILIAEPLLNATPQPSETLRRSLTLTRHLSAGALPIIAPWEVDVPEGEQWPHLNSLIESLAITNAIDMDNALLLFFEIRDDASNRVVYNSANFEGPSYSENHDVEVYLAIRDFHSDRIRAEISVRFSEDPFHEDITPLENRPELEVAIELAANELILLMQETYPERTRGPVPTFTGTYNAQNAFSYGGGVGPTLQTSFNEIDEVEAMVASRNWLQRFEPRMNTEDVREFSNLPTGVRIDESVGFISDCLEPNDYVIQVNNRPALGVHTIARPFLTGQSGNHIQFILIENGQEVYENCRIP